MERIGGRCRKRLRKHRSLVINAEIGCYGVIARGDGELLRNLRKIQDVKAIAVTGFTLTDEIEDYRAAGFSAVFQKPFSPPQIASAISQMAL